AAVYRVASNQKLNPINTKTISAIATYNPSLRASPSSCGPGTPDGRSSSTGALRSSTVFVAMEKYLLCSAVHSACQGVRQPVSATHCGARSLGGRVEAGL